MVIPHRFPHIPIGLNRWTGSNRKSPKVFRNFVMQINKPNKQILRVVRNSRDPSVKGA